MKAWKLHPDECERCGSDTEIYTDIDLPEGWGCDGDPMRCMFCGAVGQWSVCDENEAYSRWNLSECRY